MWPKRKKGKSKGTKVKLKALQPDGSSDAPENGSNPDNTGEASEQPSQHTPDPQDDLISGVWKAKVLNNYKKNPKDSHNLLARIPSGKAAFEAGERQKEELIKESMVKIVDRMFDNFQNTAYKFNQVTAGSDLELSWIRPVFSREDASSWHETAKSIQEVFTGRISTRFWTLAVRGTTQSIGVYILPADKMLAFGTSPAGFQTYCHMRPECDGMSVIWLIDGRDIDSDLLPSVYRALLDGLIRFANEEAIPNERFNLSDIGIVPEAPPAPSSSFVQSASQQFNTSQQFNSQGGYNAGEFSASEFANPGQSPGQHQLLGMPQEEPRGRPIDGFIQDISSQVALEAQTATDKIRQSMTSDALNAVSEQDQLTTSSNFRAGQMDSGFAARNLSGQHGGTRDGDWKTVSNDKGDWRQFMESTKEQIQSRPDDDASWNTVPGTQKLLAGQTSDSLNRVGSVSGVDRAGSSNSGVNRAGSAGFQNNPAAQQPPHLDQQAILNQQQAQFNQQQAQLNQQQAQLNQQHAQLVQQQAQLQHGQFQQGQDPAGQSAAESRPASAQINQAALPIQPQTSAHPPANRTIPNLVPPPGYEPLPAHVLQSLPSMTQNKLAGQDPNNGVPSNGSQPAGHVQPPMQNAQTTPPGAMQSAQPSMQQSLPNMYGTGLPPGMVPPQQQGMYPGMQPMFPDAQHSGGQIPYNGMPPQMMPGTNPGQDRAGYHSGPYGNVSGLPVHDPRAFKPPEPAPEEHVPYLLSESDFDEGKNKEYPYQIEQPSMEMSAEDQAKMQAQAYAIQAQQLLLQHQNQLHLHHQFGTEYHQHMLPQLADPQQLAHYQYLQQQYQQQVQQYHEQLQQQAQNQVPQIEQSVEARPVDGQVDGGQAAERQSGETQAEIQEQYENVQEQYEQQAEQYEEQTQEYAEQSERPEAYTQEEDSGDEYEGDEEPGEPEEQAEEQQPEEQVSESPAQPSGEGALKSVPSGFPDHSYINLPAMTPPVAKPQTFEMPIPAAAKAQPEPSATGFDSDPDLCDAVSVVLDTIDNQIERLTKQGAQAFAARDFRRAESIIKLSERLTAFKQEAQTILDMLEVEDEV